jgi:hypothetical protein
LEKAREINLDGDPSRIDPDVPLEYQTEFLPYDKKWEFPRKRLRLGSCLKQFHHNLICWLKKTNCLK